VIGTGFFASPDGHVITNYHVISQLVQEPGRYRADFIDQSGAAFALSVLAVDVVSDLAVMRSVVPSPSYFVPAPVDVKHGDRVYSLGYPHDLGITIVEGTYNGLLENTLYEKIHFTGSINPGMSGGPTLTAAGRVADVIFVELLGRRGRAVERKRIDTFPVTIGRANSTSFPTSRLHAESGCSRSRLPRGRSTTSSWRRRWDRWPSSNSVPRWWCSACCCSAISRSRPGSAGGGASRWRSSSSFRSPD
jgi:hypothetical protein